MSLCCVVCGEWYPHVGSDRLDICAECLTLNFPASTDAPPRPPPAPAVSARAALAAFVDSPHQRTPRQVEAMRRIQERWRQAEDEA